MNKKSSKKNITSDGEHNANNVQIYKYDDIDFDNIEISDFNDSGRQRLAYLNYNNTDMNIQTKILIKSDTIKLTSHGIPPISKPDAPEKEKFVKCDADREFIKIPLDKDQPGCKKLRKHLEGVDKWLGSNKMRVKLFGKDDAKHYKYQPCIRTPMPMPGKKKKMDKNGKEYPIVDYTKMKFHMAGDNQGKKMLTKLKKIEKGKKTLIKAETVTDVANEIRYGSEIRFIFYYNKIWVSSKYEYGLGFKIMVVEYKPNIGKGINIEQVDFESDEEVEDDTKQTTKFDDDENEPENEPENNIEKSPDNKKSKNNKMIKASNGTDDEEDIPVKKSKKSSKKSKEPDDEDEDVSSKKSSKKSKDEEVEEEEVEEVVEGEEEEDEEEVKPKKKSKGKSSSKSR